MGYAIVMRRIERNPRRVWVRGVSMPSFGWTLADRLSARYA